jgi:hypothetical protein
VRERLHTPGISYTPDITSEIKVDGLLEWEMTRQGRNIAIIGAILLLIYGLYVLANSGALTALFQ